MKALPRVIHRRGHWKCDCQMLDGGPFRLIILGYSWYEFLFTAAPVRLGIARVVDKLIRGAL